MAMVELHKIKHGVTNPNVEAIIRNEVSKLSADERKKVFSEASIDKRTGDTIPNKVDDEFIAKLVVDGLLTPKETIGAQTERLNREAGLSDISKNRLARK